VNFNYSVLLSGFGEGDQLVMIFVSSSSDNFVVNSTFNCKIENLFFLLDDTDDLNNPFISASGISENVDSGLSLVNVVVNYPFEESSLPLIHTVSSQFIFENFRVSYTSSNINLQSKRMLHRNAGENMCSSQSDCSPVFRISSNSRGVISNSMFQNSRTGALLIENSNVVIISTTFQNNIIRNLYSSSYPNLRFNIFVGDNGIVVVNTITTDTPGAYWIYNNGMGTIAGDELISRSPLFTPKVSGVSEGTISDGGDSILVYIFGTLLFPCGLGVNFIINNDMSTAQQTGFEVVGIGEDSVTVNIPKGLFNRAGEYYIYLTYGFGNLEKTEPFLFYKVNDGGSSEGGDGSSEGGLNSTAVTVLVVIVVIVVVVLVVIIVVFVFVYRRKQRLRGSGVMYMSKRGEGGVFGDNVSRRKNYEKSFSGGFVEGDGNGENGEYEVDNFEDQEGQEILEDVDEDNCLIFFFLNIYMNWKNNK
jgi:hypothetical protein